MKAILTFNYGEIVPDSVVDTFYNQIERCIIEGINYEHFTNALLKINGNKLPDKISTLLNKFSKK